MKRINILICHLRIKQSSLWAVSNTAAAAAWSRERAHSSRFENMVNTIIYINCCYMITSLALRPNYCLFKNFIPNNENLINCFLIIQ